MARRKDARVLLSDFDLNSGMMRFLLKLENSHSVPEACEHADEMDENLWPQLVTKVSGRRLIKDKRFQAGVLLESWNGIPFARAVEIHADRETGGRSLAVVGHPAPSWFPSLSLRVRRTPSP